MSTRFVCPKCNKTYDSPVRIKSITCQGGPNKAHNRIEMKAVSNDE
jgi:hypothetical protein